MNQRTDWDIYFLKLAMLASERSTCPTLRSGCVLVKNRQVVSVGYNGSVPNGDHCDDAGCLIVDDQCQRVISAELNALFQAAKYGKSVDETIAYITSVPDYLGVKSLITSGILRVVSLEPIKDPQISELLAKSGIEFEEKEAPFNKLRFQAEDYNSAVSFDPV